MLLAFLSVSIFVMTLTHTGRKLMLESETQGAQQKGSCRQKDSSAHQRVVEKLFLRQKREKGQRSKGAMSNQSVSRDRGKEHSYEKTLIQPRGRNKHSSDAKTWTNRKRKRQELVLREIVLS